MNIVRECKGSHKFRKQVFGVIILTLVVEGDSKKFSTIFGRKFLAILAKLIYKVS